MTPAIARPDDDADACLEVPSRAPGRFRGRHHDRLLGRRPLAISTLHARRLPPAWRQRADQRASTRDPARGCPPCAQQPPADGDGVLDECEQAWPLTVASTQGGSGQAVSPNAISLMQVQRYGLFGDRTGVSQHSGARSPLYPGLG